MDSRLKRVGTREAVYKGLATQTAGGLKKDDIIEKQFGSRIIYISKKLSNKMRENFNIIRTNNPNHFKRNSKRTLVAPKNIGIENDIIESTTGTQQQTIKHISTIMKPNNHATHSTHSTHSNHTKTQKLSFKVKENTVKNIYYPELQGINIQKLKEELVREEKEEDLGTLRQSSDDNSQPRKDKTDFTIEDMPDIDMLSLD